MLEGIDRLANLAPTSPPSDTGHFASVERDGETVRLARTIGVPLRYFVAKLAHGPFLVLSDRIDRLYDWCEERGIGWQFEPAYTRMVPAHYVVELDQVGCPDPAPRYARFFTPRVGHGPADLDVAGAAYAEATCAALTRWLAGLPADAPIGVAFSGGVDSTAVLLLARHSLRQLGSDPNRVRAFTLDLGGGRDAAAAVESMRALGLESSLEIVRASPDEIDHARAIATIEDYHPLDVECAAVALCLLSHVRQRHPQLRYLLDGDGGDENLKSYPLEDSDLTMSSVLKNPLLYHEGWGVDAIKHSLTYSGGLSRGYVRTYAPARAYGFAAFSPFTTREAIAAAQAIPFGTLSAGDAHRLYAIKGEVVSRGIADLTAIVMPVQPKRRFQDGAGGSAGAARLSKAWCRQTFSRQWERRLEDARADNGVPVHAV
jgi:asparagine synthase (glutamine-hydrolysing)